HFLFVIFFRVGFNYLRLCRRTYCLSSFFRYDVWCSCSLYFCRFLGITTAIFYRPMCPAINVSEVTAGVYCDSFRLRLGNCTGILSQELLA
ncbi:MAG: hypothetical protein FWE67_08280, partial [Planctomycetaceae bacterium]|nr:hypothetical protein [Planctomycetaceae bacterium]